MIIVKLIGGLGNQLFQYAVARNLAIKNDCQMKIDIHGFEKYKLHNYSLNAFNIYENFATKLEVDKLTRKKRIFVNKILTRALKFNPKNPPTHILEKSLNFNPDIFKPSRDIYLEGYWQSEKYFIDNSEIIKKEFTVKNPQQGKDREIQAKINAVDSVSIHIRRADYVTNSRTTKIYGLCDLEYYYRCIDRIKQHISNPHFFIFSDDSQWVKDKLKISDPIVIVDHNGPGKNYEDLRLMNQCKHNIIANSTFSWWGAWLNENSEKIVIAPNKWFNDPTIKTKDLIPENWVRL